MPLQLRHDRADVWIPEGTDLETALRQATHLAIGAHQDDIEIMAFHGILECYGRPDRGFIGVTCTDGAGSPRVGKYATYTDEEMQRVRQGEQREAACIGRYRAMFQLGYASREAKAQPSTRLDADLRDILALARPRIVYTHNPADKHATHVAVAVAAIRALRALSSDRCPEKVYGCEVWRDLDWLPDARKIALNVSDRPELAEALLRVYDSQIAGGKRYDLATLGRRRANATYLESHAADVMEAVTFAMDLTPLIQDPTVDPVRYVTDLIDEFRSEVAAQLQRGL